MPHQTADFWICCDRRPIHDPNCRGGVSATIITAIRGAHDGGRPHQTRRADRRRSSGSHDGDRTGAGTDPSSRRRLSRRTRARLGACRKAGVLGRTRRPGDRPHRGARSQAQRRGGARLRERPRGREGCGRGARARRGEAAARRADDREGSLQRRGVADDVGHTRHQRPARPGRRRHRRAAESGRRDHPRQDERAVPALRTGRATTRSTARPTIRGT